MLKVFNYSNMLVALLFVLLIVLAVPTSAQKITDVKVGPYIDKITMPVIRDYSARLLGFKANELDLVGVLPIDLDGVRRDRPDAHIIFTVGLTSLGSLHFNVQLWPVKYLEVRKALAHLFDRDRIIAESPLRGIAVKNPYIPPPTHGKWVNTSADFEKYYPYNPDKAREYLSRVFVWDDTAKTWRDPREGGREVEIEILSLPEAVSPTYWWIATYLKTEAEKIGLKIKITPVSSRELDARTSAGTAQAWIIGWSFGRFPLFMYYFFHSSELRPGGWNEWRVNHTELDRVLEKFYYAKTADEALPWAHRAQGILVEEVIPWIPTYTGVGITAVNGAIDRDTIVLAYAPPFREPVGFSYFWWNTVRFKDKPFGGTLRYHFTTDITTLHPAIYLWATEADAIFRVYASGYQLDPSDIYRDPGIDQLFKGYKVEEVSEDGKNLTKITLYLKSGLKWHDGTPFTAYDIEYTYKKFGTELKTRRYYGPYIEATTKINVVNDTTIEFYLSQYGWSDLYTFIYFTPLPKHIFERLPNPLDDPSLIPHPTVRGLTAMVGTGPFALVKREIAYAELQWYPEYIFRPSERAPQISVISLPTSVSAGSSITVRVKVVSPTGVPATDATVALTLRGPATVETTLRHVGEGVFETVLPALPPGEYDVSIVASQPIFIWSLRSDPLTAKITVTGIAPIPAPTPVTGINVSVAGVTIQISPPPTPPAVSPTPVTPEIKLPSTVTAPAETMAGYASAGLAVVGLIAAVVALFVRKS
ncbi:MAG: ABC transporter substrate-binding protein [Sulfolobales archaeon]